MVTYPDISRLGVQLIFIKDILKLRHNIEYIKEAVNTIAMLRIKRGCNYKSNMPAYLKIPLN